MWNAWKNQSVFVLGQKISNWSVSMFHLEKHFQFSMNSRGIVLELLVHLRTVQFSTFGPPLSIKWPSTLIHSLSPLWTIHFHPDSKISMSPTKLTSLLTITNYSSVQFLIMKISQSGSNFDLDYLFWRSEILLKLFASFKDWLAGIQIILFIGNV